MRKLPKFSETLFDIKRGIINLNSPVFCGVLEKQELQLMKEAKTEYFYKHQEDIV